jgi:hypothetical protein
MAADLPLPPLLEHLIESGVWPDSLERLRAQDLDPILGPEAARAVSPDDDRIILHKPPFHSIEHECKWNSKFWIDALTNVGEIDYAKSLIIADFGLGSDSVIVLNYEAGPEPRVLYLRWSGNRPNHQHDWVCSHESFEEFARAVGLLPEHAPE